MDPDSCILYVFFLLCSAYFACSETAYTAVNRVRLRTMAEKGNAAAKRALWVCDRFDKTLTTILIGNNIFHASCASLSALLVMRSFSEEYVVYGTLITTFVVYLFAEMIPKSLAKARSTELALLFSGSMVLLVRILTPISAVFAGISNVLSRLFGSGDASCVTEEELQTILETVEGEGVLEPETQALMNSAMSFQQKKAVDIMIPMSEVVMVSSTMPAKKLAEYVRTCPYSRVPVYEGSKSNIVGILPVSTFMRNYVMKNSVPLRKQLMKSYMFQGDSELSELLQRMRLNKLHMVFICDENRHKIGIITMEDLLEELVGEIQDESDAGEVLLLQ